MKIIRILLLTLILWNLPSIALFAISPELGSRLSYITTGLLGVYFFLEKKTKPNWWLIILGLLYFAISSFQFYGIFRDLIIEIVKFFVLVIGGYELAKNTGQEMLLFIILLGSLSIVIEAFFFPSNFGRYSGFYLNPNEAGFVCLFGYALVFCLKNTSLKLLGQFIFTLTGLLTFSRTFIVIWLFINIISLKVSLKNIRILGIGVLIFGTLVFIDQTVGLNNPRFEQLTNLISNNNVSTAEVTEDSRVDTWARFYNKILTSPFIGNGYGSFTGGTGELGVHNSYLMFIGEAGIVPFILFITYMGYLLFWSIYFFKKSPYLIMTTIALVMFLLTDHNFLNHYYILFVAMWIQYQIILEKKLLSRTSVILENENLNH